MKNGTPIRYIDCDEGYENYHCFEGETWVRGKVPLIHDPFTDTLQYKLIELNREYDKLITSISKTTPEYEASTWIKQEQEARAWLADNAVSTPLIDAMVNARGCTKEYLVGKIIEKADLYAAEVGRLLGGKQKLEKELIEQYKEEV